MLWQLILDMVRNKLISVETVHNPIALLHSSVWQYNLLFQAAGSDALELNLSCPHGMGERGMGLACGQVS